MSMLHEIVNPATETVLTAVEASTQAAVDAAIARSHKALLEWREVSPGDRAGCCAGSPTRSTRTWRTWPSSKWPTPGTPSATRAGRRATPVT